MEDVQAREQEPTFAIRDPRPDALQPRADEEVKLHELHRRTGTIELTLPGDPPLVAESPLQTGRLGGGCRRTVDSQSLRTGERLLPSARN